MNLIKLLRLNNGYTQEYVANVIGCCSDSYSRKENGVYTFTTKELLKLSKLYKVSLEKLIDREWFEQVILAKRYYS